jgi:hypothetical protein
MLRTLAVLAISLVACNEGQSQDTRDEIHLRATVQAVVLLASFSGQVTPVDVDPKFALTVHIESVVPAFAGFTERAVVTLAIHSPSLLFEGESPSGKTYDFVLHRKIEGGKVRFVGLTRTDKTVRVPQFAISVKLSDRAEKRLHSIGESVVVVAYFDGDALPGQGEYNPPNRDIFLGNDEKIVDRNNVARFDDSWVPLNDWNRLSDKNYFVTINTVSARKAAKDNLLDCADPIDRRIESFRGKTIEVRCWLIGEPSAPTK